MDLLANAIESIRLGLADYQAGTHPRLLSAVRNLHAGVLLLYKEALRRLSPEGSNEVLVKAKIVPSLDGDGELLFVGKGKKTVDLQQIRERFEGLGISTDWTRFKTIGDARNDVEHYHPKLNQHALRGVVAGTFVIVRDFIGGQLNADPRVLLGDAAWQAMLTETEVYDAEKKKCRVAIEEMTWSSEAVRNGLGSVSCTDCGSDLLLPGDDSADWDGPVLVCQACGAEIEPDQFVPAAVRAGLAWEMHEAQTDGGDVPYAACPQCGADSYVMADQSCALCGESVDENCVRCGQTILAEELAAAPYCAYCANQMAKDD